MRFWRIATTAWGLDKSCDGARLYGGRWNPVGVPVMYAGTTIELCALEKFVHLSGVTAPAMVLVAIDVPDEATMFTPDLAALPSDWADLPTPASAQQVGRLWLASPDAFVMLAPSAIIPESRIAVINAAHPAYADVTLKVIRDFTFDRRMMAAR
ncbi:RES family NAD+ phosphorylase [Actimicrobium antarcticum]|uniref:RES family NAD+ phosphorylase n=1 Tax=Actimicrobium antarcticum TaxID=1051899 RepID=A0ABP7T0Z3_9BURK